MFNGHNRAFFPQSGICLVGEMYFWCVRIFYKLLISYWIFKYFVEKEFVRHNAIFDVKCTHQTYQILLIVLLLEMIKTVVMYDSLNI